MPSLPSSSFSHSLQHRLHISVLSDCSTIAREPLFYIPKTTSNATMADPDVDDSSTDVSDSSTDVSDQPDGPDLIGIR
jgi:hypothetical protein